MTSRGGATIAFSSYNLPVAINATTGYSAQFAYAPDRSRWRQVSTYSGSTETTVYVGGMLEKLVDSGTSRTYWKHLIPTPSGQVQVIRRSDGVNEMLYFASDHLGSTDAVLNAAGTVVLRASFGAYGERRSSNWQGEPTSGEWQSIANTSRRGYTGHEMLDNVMLVHMNGRVYDPAIGRFISADPNIDGAGTSQGWNRYMYVHGNPTALTDPSGYVAMCGHRPCLSNGYHASAVTVTSTALCDTSWARVNNPYCGGRTSITDRSEIAAVQQSLTRQNAAETTDDGGGGASLNGAPNASPGPQEDPCKAIANANASTIKAQLPKKDVSKQLIDGFNSYFDGLGWSLTMFAAKEGWLGPEIGAQSRQIERTMAAGLVVVHLNPQLASSAALAAVQTYPWQAGARLSAGTFMAGSMRIGTGSGVLAGTAAAQGSLAHLAFNAGEIGISPEAFVLASLTGELCRR